MVWCVARLRGPIVVACYPPSSNVDLNQSFAGVFGFSSALLSGIGTDGIDLSSSHRCKTMDAVEGKMSTTITQPRENAPITTVMQPISPNKAGLVLGSLAGAWHLLWSALVLIGWAQSVIDFIFWIHFIKPVYVIGPFNAGIALILIITTAAIGYGIGLVAGVLWNGIHSQYRVLE